jgi:hypothetical protein
VRIKDLGTRSAPADLLQLFRRWRRGHAPAVPVARRQVPYWQERGWTYGNNEYTGSYQTPYGAFQGWIEHERSGHINFYLYAPSEQIRRHSHWTCFQHRSDNWYLVHMARAPRDVGSGIITIERLITEAYEK